MYLSRVARKALYFGAALCCLSSAAFSQNSPRRVIVISVDGMLPADSFRPAEHGLKMPNLDKLIGAGCASPGSLAVFPTSTYPNHTSLVTGVTPAIHGVISNTPLDPMGWQAGGWYYFAEQIQVETLYQAASKAHLTTAAVSWPVTVGAKIDYLLPEYRPVMTKEDREMMHVLSTPGLFEESEQVAREHRPVMGDEWRTAAFIHILKTRKPDLMLLHLSDVDGAQHGYGPHSPQAHQTLEAIDRQLGKIVEAVAQSDRAQNTTFVIVSDHGFATAEKRLNPMVALREAGLITTNAKGRVTDWKVFERNASGSAFFEAKDKNDADSIAKATAVVRKLAENPANGISKVYTPEELKQMGAAPDAFLGINAAAGFAIASDLNGPLVVEGASAGFHGYDPATPGLRASFILSGSGVVPCQSLANARMIDVAPTVARLLGIAMPQAQGTAIGVDTIQTTPPKNR